MSIKEYFNSTKGFGVLSTADETGKVNAAAYARPHVIDDTHVAFIMGNRLSYANLKRNPHAVYLFKQDGPGYEGKRLYLKKESESDDMSLIENTCKVAWPGPYCGERYLKNSFIVYFSIESVLPLIVYDKKK